MKTGCSLIFIIFLYMTVPTVTLSAQALNDTSAIGFDSFLSFFKTYQISDTPVDLSAIIPWVEVIEDTVFNDAVEQWAGPTVPFFNQSPMLKFQKESCWYVLIKNVCNVANIEMCFIDLVGYSISGEIQDRKLLKVMDAHGGLYWGLDEERLCQGIVLMNCDGIIHKWFENVPIDGQASQTTMYCFDSIGNILIQ